MYNLQKNFFPACVLRPTLAHMSVWKSNFFLQIGLPESLPKPPELPPSFHKRLAEESGAATRGVGERGKDKVARKKRGSTLFNFYQGIRGIESREGDDNVLLRPEEACIEYTELSKQQRSYWEHLHELFLCFEKQQNILECFIVTTQNAHKRKQKLLTRFYHFQEWEVQQLVRDYLAERWEKENYPLVHEIPVPDNLTHLVEIRRDLRVLLSKVEKVLAPQIGT
jgi:hypothetical protein